MLVLWMFITSSISVLCAVQADNEDKPVYCAYHRENNKTGSNGNDETFGKVMPNNKTIRCKDSKDYCFTFWTVDPNNDSNISIITQDCWNYNEDENKCKDTCISDNSKKHSSSYYNSEFCCCSGNMCNENVTYKRIPVTDIPMPTEKSEPHISVDPSYKQKTIIICLASLCSVALLAMAGFLLYRLCMNHRQPSMDSLNLVEAPPTPGFEIEDLKICTLIGKGRYGEVWRGMLQDQEVAVKIFNHQHRLFYANEKYIYTLPHMDHENLLKFYGADERILPDGAIQYLLVFSYVSLGPLTGYLKNNVVDWSTLCRMAQSITQGLAHLHTDVTKGEIFKPAIAHRDVNSRNVLVKVDLSCVLADLGFCMSTMGSKLIRNGYIESAEQSSLTDVGTVRYMAPELLDGAVNLRDCEASLKQIDIYSLGLVLWEVATRCTDLYYGNPVPEYKLPYQAEAGIHPSFEEMQLLVSRNKARPQFPDVWKDSNQAIHALKETIEDCWDQDAEARLTALCIIERINDMKVLWAQDSRQKGVTPTLNPTVTHMTVSEESSGIRIGNITKFRQAALINHNCNLPNGSLTLPADGTMAPLIAHSNDFPLPNGHPRNSLLQEKSVSASTTETFLTVTPSDTDPPPKYHNLADPPPKYHNFNLAKANTVIQPHQGRNPTVERNTHKRSDEELTVSGNTLVSASLKKDQDNIQQPASQFSEDPFDSGQDNLETALVQSDVLNYHRNPPIPYVQNQVHSDSPLVRPKMANVPGNGVPYTKLAVNESKESKSRFGKLKKPKDFTNKLSQLTQFGRNLLSRSQQSIDSKEKKSDAMRAANTQKLLQPVQTEVRLQNGSAVVRPSSLPPSSGGQDSNFTAHCDQNKLKFAEVGIAKLEHAHPDSLPAITNMNGSHSKSTSYLTSPDTCDGLQSKHLSDIENLNELNDIKSKRPTSLSLKGHNYSNSSRTLDSRASGQAEPLSDPSEKIRRRVKTPLKLNKNRFSLYDDRVMSQSYDDVFLGTDKMKLTKSSISLQQFANIDSSIDGFGTAHC